MIFSKNYETPAVPRPLQGGTAGSVALLKQTAIKEKFGYRSSLPVTNDPVAKGTMPRYPGFFWDAAMVTHVARGHHAVTA